MPTSHTGHIIIYTPESGFEIWVNDVDYTGYALTYEFKTELNQASSFMVKLTGTEDADRTTNLMENKIVRLMSKNILLFKGTIATVEYETYGDVTLKGNETGEMILKARTVRTFSGVTSDTSSYGRPLYENIGVDEVISTQLSGISSVTVDATDNGASLGSGTFRGDFDSRLSMLAGVITGKNGDWWFTHGTKPFTSNILHASTNRGSLTSVYTFNSSGDDQNTEMISNEKDYDSLWNHLTVLGYGDGYNQLRSTIYHATVKRTKLSASISSSATTVTVDDGSLLDASGTVWIGMEQCAYTKSGNTLTLTRPGSRGTDANSQDYLSAYAHSQGVAVWDAEYLPDSTDGSSKIDTDGIKEHSLMDKTIFDQDTLDVIATKAHDDHMELISRIILNPADPYPMARDIAIGDLVTINDSEAGLSTTYRICSKRIVSEEGNQFVEFEVSNSEINLTGDLYDSKKLSDVESKYMQGAVNIYTINETENTEAGTESPGPIELFFEIPEDAIALTSVKLAYRNESPRIWNNVTVSGGALTSANNSAAGGAYGGATGSTTLTSASTWYTLINNIGTLASTNTMFGMVTVNFKTDVITNGLQLAIRVDGTDYYPGNLQLQDTIANEYQTVVLLAPIDFSTKADVDLVAQSGTAGAVLTWASNAYYVGKHTHVGAAHAHDVDYDITNKDYTTSGVSAIQIYTATDASGTPNWEDKTSLINNALVASGRTTLLSGVNQSMANIDLTDYYLSGVVTGWKGLKFATNGNSRHKVDLSVKCYVNSKKGR